MALSNGLYGAWVFGTGAVSPAFPTGTITGDLYIATLISKYDDAVLPQATLDALAAQGFTDHGFAVNASRATGNDNGPMRSRTFSKIWSDGDPAPSFDPAPNNVSATRATSYRSATGAYNIQAVPVVDDSAGSPVVLTANLDVVGGDRLLLDFAINGDVATFGANTVSTLSGANQGTSGQAVDGSSSLGTDIRARSYHAEPVSGAATQWSFNQPLSGTVTNAVAVGTMLRIREAVAAPPPAVDESKFFQFL